MAAPAQKWKAKGIELALWENSYGDTYTLTKSYKSKKTGEWVKESIKLYPNELELVGEVVAKGVAYSLGANSEEDLGTGGVPLGDYGIAELRGDTYVEVQRDRNYPNPPKFDDDDIPF